MLDTKHQFSYVAGMSEFRENAKPTASTNGPKTMDIPKEDEQFISSIKNQVDSFMSDENQKELSLESCSAFRRKLIYNVIQSKYQSGIDMVSKITDDNQRYISISKCSEKEKHDRIQAKVDSDLADLDATVGFRKVMDHLSASKKLIIGHCMYLDIFHMIEQFFFPLPQDLQEFKSMVRMAFPHLMDTKSLVNSEKLKGFFESTSLSAVASQLQGKALGLPKIETEEGFGYTLESEQYHEAGYDAFLSGVCFIGLARKLGAVVQKTERINLSSKHLIPYTNRFHILKHFDIPYLNLGGPDPEPSRDNVFYVSFPSEWKTVDLVEMFLAYGNIYVSWLDETSALVALKNAHLTLVAKKNLLNKPSRLYQVMPYSEYQKWTLQKYETLKGGSIRSSNLSAEFRLAGSKRRNSGSIDGSGSCSMELIPEDDENEAETSDATALPPAKKLKPIEEESEEISSTAIIFDEDNAW